MSGFISGPHGPGSRKACVRFVPRGTISLDEAGLPVVTGDDAPVQAPIAGPINVAIRDGRMLGHYFHFFEILVAIHAAHRAWFPHSRLARMFVGAQPWNNPAQNHTQSALMQAIYRETEIVEGQPREAVVDNILVIDRWTIHSFINKFLEPFLDVATAHYGDLRKRAVAHVATSGAAASPPFDPPAARRKQAIFVTRPPPRVLAPTLEQRLLDLLEATGFTVAPVDYAKLAWHEQVRQTHAVDLLIGVHGNGLTNAAWLRRGAALVEFFPAGQFHYDYQVLAEIVGLTYYGFEGVERDGRIARDGGRYGQPSEDSPNVAVEALPWGDLRRVLGSLSAAVDERPPVG